MKGVEVEKHGGMRIQDPHIKGKPYRWSRTPFGCTIIKLMDSCHWMSDDRFVYQPSSHKATEHFWWRELSRLHRNLCLDHLSIKRFWMFWGEIESSNVKGYEARWLSGCCSSVVGALATQARCPGFDSQWLLSCYSSHLKTAKISLVKIYTECLIKSDMAKILHMLSAIKFYSVMDT